MLQPPVTKSHQTVALLGDKILKSQVASRLVKRLEKLRYGNGSTHRRHPVRH